MYEKNGNGVLTLRRDDQSVIIEFDDCEEVLLTIPLNAHEARGTAHELLRLAGELARAQAVK